VSRFELREPGVENRWRGRRHVFTIIILMHLFCGALTTMLGRRLARMRLFVLFLVTLLTISTATRAYADGQAPAHSASQAALDAALRQQTAATTADRDAVLRVLDHAQVKDVAARAGVDLRQARSAVATMSNDQLAQVSAQAKTVDQALAGGASTVVISTTTIIIALLVVILLVVAID
jgi:hypothetical protein